jgi:ABC-type transport system involved in multi-copper enzyme maturation permease subunit
MATRPNGIFWLLAGKYLVAVTWGFSASMAGILIAVPVSGIDSMFSVWLSLSGLCLLSSVSYAAVYLLIGVSFPQRAMVFCVAYTAAVEVAVSFIPAVINRITVQYRLRSLFLSWLQPELNIDDFSFFDAIAGGESAITEILWLLTLTALFFAAAIAIALRREFTAAAESDV